MMIFRVFQIVVRYSSVLLRLSGKKLKNVLGVIGAIREKHDFFAL